MDGAHVRNALQRGCLFRFLLALCDARAALRIRSCERGEVMIADNVLGGTQERFFVHWVGIVIDVTGQKRRTNSAAIKPVAIGFSLGGMSRVKAVVYHLYRINPHRGRKNVIKR